MALNVFRLGSRTSDMRSTKDRKSTRLNSSHLVISYAVFCLKKKKNLLTLYYVLIVRRDLVPVGSTNLFVPRATPPHSSLSSCNASHRLMLPLDSLTPRIQYL